MNGPGTRMTKRNKLSHYRWTSNNVILTEKTWAGNILIMSQGLKKAANEGPRVLYICFCSLQIISKKQPGACARAWQKYTKQGCMGIFLGGVGVGGGGGGSVSNRENARAPTQFRRERVFQHVKRWLLFNNSPIHLYINSTRFIRPVKQNKLVFPALNSTSHLMAQSKEFHRWDSSWEANFSHCQKINAWLHLQYSIVPSV